MAQSTIDIKTLQNSLRECLLGMQDSSGGWGEHTGSRLSVFNTAEVVIALVESGSAVGEEPVQRALAFILQEKVDMIPPDKGTWPRTVGPRKLPDIIRTSMVVSALVMAGTNMPEARLSIDWLIGRQKKDDGGWGYKRGDKSEILPTCFVLLTLLRTSGAAGENQYRTAIDSGLTYLNTKCRNRNGSFGAGSLIAAHTIYSCLAFQSARICGFNVPPATEGEAIDWLLDKPDMAVAPVDEEIAIDPQGKEGNYAYTFSMEQLLLRMLSQSTVESHRQTELWLRIQRSLNGKLDDSTGGLFGQRVFSWSTAAGLQAIAVGEKYLSPIPPSRGEDPDGIKVGPAILLLETLLVAAIVYLASSEHFSVLLASIFGFFVLAFLLAYGKIGERTFRQLTSELIGRSKSKKGDDGPQNA
jgi:Prenyltransferase and squalene oxidase repeat